MKLPISDQLNYVKQAEILSSQKSISLVKAIDQIIKEYNLPISRKTLLNLKGMRDAILSHTQASNNEQLEELNDILRRENKRLKTKIKRMELKEQDIIEATKEAISKIPNLPIVNIPKPKKKFHKKPEIAMLDLSDIHMGEYVRKSDTAGLNEYNVDIFKKQCHRLTEAILEIIDIQRSGGIKVDTLFINCLGDLVTNEHIYKNQPYFLDRMLIDQIFELGDFFVKTVLCPLIKNFKQVKILGVRGNHGRYRGEWSEYPGTNFDTLLLLFWKKMLEDNKRCQIYVSDSSFMLYEIFDGQTHLLAHGDNIRSYLNIPMYGLTRYYNRMINLTRTYIDFLHVGHFHQRVDADINYGTLLVNGSWVGGSDLSVNKLQASAPPIQLFYGVNKDKRTWSYEIYLREPAQKLSDNPGMIKTPLKEINHESK